jgi:hypothetical protein
MLCSAFATVRFLLVEGVEVERRKVAIQILIFPAVVLIIAHQGLRAVSIVYLCEKIQQKYFGFTFSGAICLRHRI